MHDTMSCVRYHRRALRSAAVCLAARDVPRGSASCRMTADAAKFVRGNSLRTAASCSRAIGQRDWSATMEGYATLSRASVGVDLMVHSLSSLFFHYKETFLTSRLPSFSWNQLNQMEDPANTTTRSTRMGRTSVQTVNTSAPAWTELLVVSPSVPTWSFYPCWAA